MKNKILKSSILSLALISSLNAGNYFLDGSIGYSTLSSSQNDKVGGMVLADSPDEKARNFELGLGYSYNKDYFTTISYFKASYDDMDLKNTLISVNKMMSDKVYLGLVGGNSDIKLKKSYTNLGLSDGSGSKTAFGAQLGYISSLSKDLEFFTQYRYLKAKHKTELKSGTAISEHIRDKHHSLNIGIRWTFGGFFEKEPNKKMEKKVIEKKKPKVVENPQKVVPPKVVDKDTDGDGLMDRNDRCPNTASKNISKVDMYGCYKKSVLVEEKVSINNDIDKDGVINTLDRCPNTPTGISVDTNGCEILTVPVNLGIVFKSSSDAVQQADLSKFNLYVDYLNKNPDAKIVIEAHTDSIGEAQINLTLSKKRANSAKDILVDKGIDSNRIETIGYGETKPLVPNTTRANRQLNRRVNAIIK